MAKSLRALNQGLPFDKYLDKVLKIADQDHLQRVSVVFAFYMQGLSVKEAAKRLKESARAWDELRNKEW